MSKLDFSTVLRNLHGEPLQEPKLEKGKAVTVPVLDDQKRPIMIGSGERAMPLHEQVMKDITAKDLAIAALTANAVKGEKISGDEQLKRADIALRVLRGESVSKDDQVEIKKIAKDLGFGTELLFAFCRFIDEKPQIGEEPSAPAPKAEKPAAAPLRGKAAGNGDARPQA